MLDRMRVGRGIERSCERQNVASSIERRPAALRGPLRAPVQSTVVHCVYIVRCADGTFYTGYARDPDARAKAHNSGRGARYTSGRRPVTLVHVERFRSLGKALRREHELKQWTRAEKIALVEGPAAARGTRRGA
jgi:putative endonuclease